MPPVRNLLLTFDQLTPEDISRTSGSVTLSQHYLRYPGAASITGATVCSDEQRRKLRIVAVANETLDGVTGLAALNPEVCDFENAIPIFEREIASTGNPEKTLWIHVQNERSYSAEFISQLLEAVRSNRPSEGLLAVSAFRQSHTTVNHPFDILVDENSIRVPASLEHSAFPNFHSQAITSSTDLLHTLLLNSERNDISSELKSPEHDDGPTDLIPIAIHPGRPWNRRIQIEIDPVRALRDEHFLYAAEVDSAPHSSVVRREALFVKPQDLWNVHDVSSEYLETTDLMRQQLGLS